MSVHLVASQFQRAVLSLTDTSSHLVTQEAENENDLLLQIKFLILHRELPITNNAMTKADFPREKQVNSSHMGADNADQGNEPVHPNHKNLGKLVCRCLSNSTKWNTEEHR